MSADEWNALLSENERLRDALTEIVDVRHEDRYLPFTLDDARAVANAALAAPSTDSPYDSLDAEGKAWVDEVHALAAPSTETDAMVQRAAAKYGSRIKETR